MAEIFVIKQRGKFLPADDEATAAFKKIANGEVLRLKYSRPRNYRFHQKFFALLNVAFDSQSIYSSFEAFRMEVIITCGWYDVHHHISGGTSLKAKSISFAKMDESEFSTLYETAIDVILNKFMPDTDAERLEEEIDRVLSFA